MQLQRDETFSEIYNALYADIYRFTCYLQPDRTDVSERVEAIFLQVYRGLKHYQGECSYKVWTFMIAHQVLHSPLQRFRKQKAGLAQQQELLPVDESQSADEDEEQERRVQMEAVRRHFDLLSQKEREVILLQSVYGFSAGDLAVILGIGEGAARTRIEQTAEWTQGIEAKAREWVPDVLGVFAHVPSDFELLAEKSAGQERVRHRIKRGALRARVLPIAAVTLVAVVGLTAYLMPGQLRESANSQPVAPVQAVDTEIDLGGGVIRADLPVHEVQRLRMEAYRNEGYQMLYGYENTDLVMDSKGLYLVILTPGESKAKLKQLLSSDGIQFQPGIRGSSKSYVIMTTTEGNGGSETIMLVDLNRQSITPIPTGDDAIGSAAVWEQATPKVVYCATDLELGRTAIVAYDVETGKEETLHEMSAGGANYVFTEGDTLVINAHTELYVVQGTDKRLVAKADQASNQELSAYAVKEGQLLYIVGRQMGGQPGRAPYTGKTKVMTYNIEAGQSKSLLGDVPGDQYLIYPWIEDGNMLIGNFFPGPDVKLPNASAEQPADFSGTTQIWQMSQDGTVKLRFEHAGMWSTHWFDFRGYADQHNQQFFLVPQTMEYALLIDSKSDLTKKITMREMQDHLQKNASF